MPTSKAAPAPAEEARRRRPRGEPRRLLIEASRELFDRRGYSSTTTRDIAEQAAVAETLIFRYFGNKAELFRQAMVTPFVDALDDEIERQRSRPANVGLTRDDARVFVGSLYDMFREHRALAAMVFSADALLESELAQTGLLDEVRDAIERFVGFASEEARAGGGGLTPTAHAIAIRGHMAMVAGMATFGDWYFGNRRPSRRSVIEEMTEWIWIRYTAGRSASKGR